MLQIGSNVFMAPKSLSLNVIIKNFVQLPSTVEDWMFVCENYIFRGGGNNFFFLISTPVNYYRLKGVPCFITCYDTSREEKNKKLYGRAQGITAGWCRENV